MRLDKWLKVSRLIKRRTVANEACDNARVMANGRPVKASYDVKEGDVLELRFGERTVKVEVLVVAEHMGKTEAAAMYREIFREIRKRATPQNRGGALLSFSCVPGCWTSPGRCSGHGRQCVRSR